MRKYSRKKSTFFSFLLKFPKQKWLDFALLFISLGTESNVLLFFILNKLNYNKFHNYHVSIVRIICRIRVVTLAGFSSTITRTTSNTGGAT
jgi:hypothetical protein